MVYGGKLILNLMQKTKTPVIPIDSELSAIFQFSLYQNGNNFDKNFVNLYDNFCNF